MTICVLGEVGARRADGRLDRLAAAKPATVLAVLAVNAGTQVAERALIEALWPTAMPASGRTALQTYVSQVRSFLEPGRPRRSPGRLIRTVGEGYQLDVDDDGLDATRFERLLGRAIKTRPRDPAAAEIMVSDAMALWQPPLGVLADRPWARSFVSRLEELHRTAVEERFALALLMGRHEEILGALRPAIAAEPYRERLVGQLMLALYRCGRQGEALRVYRDARERLVTDLGVEPGKELALLHRAILAGDAQLDFRGDTAVEASPRARTTVSGTPLVGRTAELAQLGAALELHRVVTVVGPGGAGKTRLVQQLLATKPPMAAERTWVVDLAPLSRDAEVMHAVARALRLVEHPLVPIGDQLASALGQAPALLVLDTCERVAEGVAATVTELLRSPGVRVLATSRRPLRLGEAHVLHLRPLGLPRDDDPRSIMAADAVRLLCQRAGIDHTGIDHTGTDHTGGRTQPPSRSELRHLASICRRLDGLPLAIELAARRLRAVGAAELDARLGHDLDLLDGMADAPTRHRTIDATVRWSTDLLDAEAQLALTRAAAFAGPFTLPMAEQVLADQQLSVARVLPALIRLADASLLAVVADPGRAGVRYRLLDTVRAVARHELLDAEQRAAARRRHTDWVLGMVVAAQKADRDLRSAPVALETIPDEIDAVLAYLQQRPGDPRHMVLAAGLPFFWRHTGQLSQGRAHVAQALQTGEDADPRLRAAVLGGAGFLAFYQGDYAEGARATTEALQLAESLGLKGMAAAMRAPACFGLGDLEGAEDAMRLALAHYDRPGRHRLVLLNMGAQLAWYRGDHAVAAARFREEAVLGEQTGHEFVVAQALRGQGVMLAYLGQPERGWGLCTRSLGIAKRRGDDLSIAQSHAACAAAAAEAGVAADATAHAVEALQRSARQLDIFALLLAVPVLALLDVQHGRPERAARLIGWYAGTVDATGVFPAPRSAAQLAQASRAVRDVLARAAVARLRAAGGALPVTDLTA
ncbi:MAG TPA: BTAD domain-containing putative transcriptional regulator [Euzebya sp.]|nr:BTAD domain-containing putative transcriptional regulator [Euzebya sp.]